MAHGLVTVHAALLSIIPGVAAGVQLRKMAKMVVTGDADSVTCLILEAICATKENMYQIRKKLFELKARVPAAE